MTGNYTVSDLLTISAATGLLAFFALASGYTLGWLLNLMGFRRHSRPEQVLMSIAFSLALCPIITYWLERFASITAVWGFYAAAGAGSVVLLGSRLRTPRGTWREPLLVFAIMGGWSVLGLFVLTDIQVGDRLYFPSAAYDYTIRAAFTSAITRTGVPPSNPLFFPGHAVSLHYHYFWLIICSLLNRIGAPAIGARQAVIAGSLWSGVALIGMIPLYLRFFATGAPSALWRRSLLGIGLLAVTGLDILPTVLLASAGAVYPSIEWWNTGAMAWVGAALWVPHHPAALIACLMGFLILWDASVNQSATRDCLLGAVVAGLAFATAAGTSIYVALVFAVFLASWLLLHLIQRKIRDVLYLAISGVASLAFTAPFLMELRSANAGGSFVEFAVRRFPISALFLPPSWRGSWVDLQSLLLLPLNYFLEFGFFFAIAILWCAKHRVLRQPLKGEQWAGLLMVASSVLVCTFLRSSSIASNELGIRGLLVAEFMLLIWAVEIMEDWGKRGEEPATPGMRSNKKLLKVLLVLGVAGSVYEIGIARTYGILVDHGTLQYSMFSPDRQLGKRTYALRQAYDQLRAISPRDAVVQHDPKASFGDVFHGLYAERQSAASGILCGATFGGDGKLCPQVIIPINEIFDKPEAFDPAAVNALCRKLAINYLVVKDTDRAWHDNSGWAFRSVPVLANQFARIYACGKEKGAPTGARLADPTDKSSAHFNAGLLH